MTPAPRALFVPFLFAYLLDYFLTLAGTLQVGFHEQNPIAGHLWNAGDYATPFLLKLLGALLMLLLVHVADAGTTRKHATRLLQGGTLLFTLLDLASIHHLTP